MSLRYKRHHRSASEGTNAAIMRYVGTVVVIVLAAALLAG